MKILIEFAHPALQKSKVNKHLIKAALKTKGIHVNDLYECYPDFNIDVKREQQLLIEHDVIVFQHPFYWYSCPALLKEWQDVVLEYGFAYGESGNALRGKILFSVISTGGTRASYRVDGLNRFTMTELLSPFVQTANLCGMMYLAPFLVQGTHSLSEERDIPMFARKYRELLESIRDDTFDMEKARTLEQLNPII